MQRVALLVLAAWFGVVMPASTPGNATPRLVGQAADNLAVAEVSGQSRPRRVRPQIRVQPRYPYRAFHSFYPLPYQYEYPGPNGVRQCVNRYVLEPRPSGTVLVPRMRCWWIQG
jgi:hypothetical protein